MHYKQKIRSFYGTRICPMHAVFNPVIQTSTLQRHPGSKFMVPIGSTRLVFYSTSIDTVIVSVTIFAIFDVQFGWPWSRPVQGHPGSEYMGQSKAHWWFSIWPHLSPLFYMSLYSRHLMRKSSDLDLERFKVVQGQRSQCQSTAYGWFPIRHPLTPSSYMSPFLKYLTCNFDDLEIG